MKLMSNDEMFQTKGGAVGWIMLGIAALVIFGIGVIDGYTRPLKCN